MKLRVHIGLMSLLQDFAKLKAKMNEIREQAPAASSPEVLPQHQPSLRDGVHSHLCGMQDQNEQCKDL